MTALVPAELPSTSNTSCGATLFGCATQTASSAPQARGPGNAVRRRSRSGRVLGRAQVLLHSGAMRGGALRLAMAARDGDFSPNLRYVWPEAGPYVLAASDRPELRFRSCTLCAWEVRSTSCSLDSMLQEPVAYPRGTCTLGMPSRRRARKMPATSIFWRGLDAIATTNAIFIDGACRNGDISCRPGRCRRPALWCL